MKLTTLSIALAGSMFFVGCGDKPANGTTTTTSTATSTTSTTTTSLSDDDAHKLYQAAANTGDATIIMNAQKKIGLYKGDMPDSDKMTKFSTDHGAWAQKNVPFITEMSDKAKANDYVKAHM